MTRLVYTNLPTFAFPVPWPGGMVVVGRYGRRLKDSEFYAVIQHEKGHIAHRHVRARLWRLVTFRWRGLEAMCREQELEADAYAVRQGQARGLVKFLARFPESHKNALHPTPGERIANVYRVLEDMSHGK